MYMSEMAMNGSCYSSDLAGKIFIIYLVIAFLISSLMCQHDESFSEYFYVNLDYL